MSQPLNIVIVERLGVLKNLSVKDFNEGDLYKKCGFKKADGFYKQTHWRVKLKDTTYLVQLYAKKSGRANSENKYEFPPPMDNDLFYGSCALVALNAETLQPLPLSVSIWEKMYEKLFGGFEDLVTTSKEDKREEDDLDNVPKEKKTKNGYLKDGFVVDSDDPDQSAEETEDDEAVTETDHTTTDEYEEDNDDDTGSELSEESYDYDDDDEE